MPTLFGINGRSLSADIGGSIQQGLDIRGERQRQELQQLQFNEEQKRAAAEARRQARLQDLLGQLGGGSQLPAVATPGINPAPRAGLPGLGGPSLDQAGAAPSPVNHQNTSEQARRDLEIQFPEMAKKIAEAQKANFDNKTERQKQRITSVVQAAAEIQGLPAQQQINKLKQRRERLVSDGIPTNDTDEHITLLESGRVDEANALTDQAVQMGEQIGVLQEPASIGREDAFGKSQQLQSQRAADSRRLQSQTAANSRALQRERLDAVKEGVGLSAGQIEFASLTEDLTEDQKEEATLIKLGLSPRAVGSAVQTISAEGIAEEIGDVKATIKEREKFGELTGSSRASTIDSGFSRIIQIDQNLLNLDKAIAAVEAGAGTGAITRRFPSIKAASVELDQIQGELALDVIGGVTFGALSKGELDLAKQVALPTGLNGPQLVQHLQDRKSAQGKLRNYFKEQVDFLDQGGSVAGFLREKERKIGQGGSERNITVDF